MSTNSPVVLGVVSGAILTDNIDNIPSEGNSIRNPQWIDNTAFGISYTLAKDSNGNNRFDSSDQVIGNKGINSNVSGLVVLQTSVTPGNYFLKLTVFTMQLLRDISLLLIQQKEIIS